MEYYILSQDESIHHTVAINPVWIPKKWKPAKVIERKIELMKDDILYGQSSYNFLVKSDSGNVYPDLLEVPLPLISTEMKEIFCSYESHIQCACALLSDRELKKQHVYWLFALERIACLGEGIEFYPNKNLKKLVLDKNRIGSRKIFRIQGIIEKRIIISFDVAESMLRRPLAGINLEKVECIGE